MMDSISDLEGEAKSLVEEIRAKHTTVAHEELALIVTDLLHITSSELYDVSTHCILELLQNADDNHYNASVVPTLGFTYEVGCLQVDCNELGFEAKHVKAISTIRRSTKSGKNHSYGYTGEKGIGFKSVFRIADEVYISSRQYRFKFDKTQRFGIIAPMWAAAEDFPMSTSPTQTSFVLKLSKDCDQVELVQELQNFNPIFLLFLRRLRKVVLRVRYDDRSEWVETICKTTTEVDGELFTVLDVGRTQQRYLTLEHRVENLPKETRRPDCSTSELNLAFPVTDLPGRPRSDHQQVFALLPISDYGLKFMLNGDFVLSASRLNIDASLPWNQRLRDGLADAFLSAVDRFNTGTMKYFWPFYVPDSNVAPFFQPARDSILRELRDSAVLVSEAGTMCKPSCLIYVDPTKYTDSDRHPFTLNSDKESKYLSNCYPEWTIDSIISLGVSRLTDREFLTDLELMVTANPKRFRDQSPQWQQQLSKALLPLTRTYLLKSVLSRLPIIPLSGGTWTSANTKPVFFSKSLDPSKFPNSIELSVVDPVVAADYNRYTLFQALGITEVDTQRLCRHIVDAHASTSFNPERLTRAELISHATFLFKASWQPPEGLQIDLWFATADGGRCKGSQLYIRGDWEAGSPTARIFDKLREKFSTLHENYFLGPVCSDAVRLSDHFDCPFATYRTLDINSTSGETSRLLNPWDTENNMHNSNVVGTGESHMIFDIDDDFFPMELNGRRDAPMLLTRNSEDASASKRARGLLPTSQVVHNDYLTPGRFSRRKRKPQAWNFFGDSFPESKTRKSWKAYMMKTLYLSEIPRLVSFSKGAPKCKYHLSEEFRFLLKTCPVSDVLHLLNEHWASYAQWIELDTLNQKDSDAVSSNERLIKEIGDSLVRTRHGLAPLQETILPGLDTHIDNLEIPLPILDIDNTKDKTLRRRLTCFGIKVDNDIQYYLMCLKSICKLEGFPEHDTISYVYEQIQTRYPGNEDEINEIFDSNRCIYVGALASGNSRSSPWLKLTDSVKRRIDIGAVYPECKSLFHWLLEMGTDEVESSIKNAASIDRSWNLRDISALFISISTYLTNTTAVKARIWVKSLRKSAIFPVRKSKHQNSYDELLSSEDNTWFIADRPYLNESFQGVVPLLAFSAQEIERMNDLLVSLSLDSRKLSKLSDRTVFPSGNLKYSDRDTRFFQSRSVYIKLLIPKSHPDREMICTQLENAIVSTADSISQRYVMRYKDQPERFGNLSKAEVTMKVGQGRHGMRIFIARQGLISQQPSFELIDMIAAHCEIKDRESLRLLYGALSDRNNERVRDAFAAVGYRFYEYRQDPGNGKSFWQSQSRSADTMQIPSAFERGDDEYGPARSIPGASGDGARLDRGPRGGIEREPQNVDEEATSDRRLPMMHFSRADMKQPENPIDPQGLFVMGSDMDPSQHLQYLGQRLAQKHQFSQPIDGRSKHIMILVRISDVYSSPRFHIFINPWDLHVSNRLIPQGEAKFKAIIKEQEQGTVTNSGYPVSPQDAKDIESQSQGQSNGFDSFDQQMAEIHRRIEVDPQQRQNGVPAHTTALLKVNASASINDINRRPYSYQRLIKEEVRLLMVFPGKQKDPLRGTIFTCSSITNAGPYRALSYEWGPATKERRLFTENGVLKLRHSLYTAILQLRQEDNPIVLWVDAICINQANETEKAQQIPLLPRIFQNATCTLAFIGGDSRSDDAIQTLLQIRARGHYGFGSKNWPPKLQRVPLSWGKEAKPLPTDPIWTKIKEFFDRTWFRRVWIVQEVVAARIVRVVCGKWMVEWNELQLAMDIVQQEPRLPQSIAASWAPFLTLSNLREWEARNYRWSLLTLIDTFRYVDSTLKRDRFFALLGLASDGNRKEFEPDYKKETTFEAIACRYGRAFVERGKGMQLLCRAGLSLEPDRFPSWLPDLTVQQNNHLVNSHDRGIMYSASRGLFESIRYIPTNALAVRGCFVDEIVQVSKSSNGNGSKQWIRYFEDVDRMVDDICGWSPSTRCQRLKIEVPVAGAMHLGEISIEDSYAAFRHGLKKANYRPTKQLKNWPLDCSEPWEAINVASGGLITWREKSMEYISLLRNNPLGWRFATTKRKLCGLVPNGAQVGDLVSIFGGGDVPFLLRKSPKTYGFFRLVGGCYMDGMMDGEAVQFSGVLPETINIH